MSPRSRRHTGSRSYPKTSPIDVIAKAVSEIALSDAESGVANVTNAKTSSWTNDLLPALREAGLQFDEVEPKEWVRRLAESSDDAVANPPKKLLDFFASKYDKDTFAPSRTYQTSVATFLSSAHWRMRQYSTQPLSRCTSASFELAHGDCLPRPASQLPGNKSSSSSTHAVAASPPSRND